jgi:hypothetical protein
VRRRDTDAERFSSSQIQWIPTGAKYYAVVQILCCHFFVVLSNATKLIAAGLISRISEGKKFLLAQGNKALGLL